MLTPLYTPDQFAQALTSPRPVILLWGMPGCGACQETKPVVRRYAARHTEVDAYEINVNALEELADRHHIQATPTLMVYLKGQRLARRTGALTEEQFERWMAKTVSST
jgi:thioredoxin-like negative regulator of GroEL